MKTHKHKSYINYSYNGSNYWQGLTFCIIMPIYPVCQKYYYTLSRYNSDIQESISMIIFGVSLNVTAKA